MVRHRKAKPQPAADLASQRQQQHMQRVSAVSPCSLQGLEKETLQDLPAGLLWETVFRHSPTNLASHSHYQACITLVMLACLCKGVT